MKTELRRNFRGDVPQHGRAPVLERRQWARLAPRQTAASISWMLRGRMITVVARVVDLSRGGAGVLIPRVPPPDAPLRLALLADPAVRVDGRAVGMRSHPNPDWVFLHLQFDGECPPALLERALGRPGDAEDDDEADDPAMDDDPGMSYT